MLNLELGKTIFIYYWNLHLLIYVTIIQTKVLLPQTLITLEDFDYPF